VVDHSNANAHTGPNYVVQGGATALEALDLVVSHDPQSIVADMVNQVRGIEMRLHGGNVGSVIGQTILERARTASAAIVERASAPFRLCVVGEFKRGKSSLVNALLGEVVAPVDPLPETITVNSFSYGPAFSAEMRLKSGGRIALRREHLPRAALQPIIEAAPSGPLGIDIRMPIAQLQDIVLVDMPGTGDFSPDVERQVREQVAATDLLVVVINVLSPLSESERTLLRHAIKPHDFPKILFVVNMIDLIEFDSELDRIRTHMAAELGKQFPGMRIYLLSSRSELGRAMAISRANPVRTATFDSMFDAFRKDLNSIVAGQRDSIRADRVGAACSEVLADMEIRLQMLARSLSRRSDELQLDIEAEHSAEARLDGELDARRHALTAAVSALSDEAEGWMRGFAARLTTSFATQLEGVSRSNIERDMQFYITTCVESAIQCCVEAHTSALEAIGKNMLGETADLEVGALGKAARSVSALAFSGAQWNVGQTIRFALDQVLGLGLAVDILSGIISLAVPGSDSRQYVAGLTRESQTLAESIVMAARATYTAIAKDLISRLEHEYGGRRQALLDATQQAATLHRERSGELSDNRLGLDEALRWVRESSDVVNELRARVGPCDGL
jgi:GTPase SAR1 family protein